MGRQGTHLHRNVSLTVVLNLEWKTFTKAPETHSTVGTGGSLGPRPILSAFFLAFSLTLFRVEVLTIVLKAKFKARGSRY